MWYVTLPDDISKGTSCEKRNGVPYTKIPYTQEYHPHATNIASYVLRTWNRESAHWLLDNMEYDGAIWHHFSFPFYDDFPKDWVGGLAQGLTISALVGMHKRTGDVQYLHGAKKAYHGLLEHCVDRDYWIYEYPNIPTILNGNLYTLVGVLDLVEYHHDVNYFFEQSLRNIILNLHRYDTGYWSLYDLEKKFPATSFYHHVHGELLEFFYKVTAKPPLCIYMCKFGRYEAKLFNEKIASVSRLYKIIKTNGILESYRRYKRRKEWK